MKNYKKWNKMFLAGMAVMALTFGLVLAGCATNSTVVFDKTIPVEEQSALKIDAELEVVKFDETSGISWRAYWGGTRTEMIPAGTHTLVANYSSSVSSGYNTYTTTTANGMTITHDFLPRRVYRLTSYREGKMIGISITGTNPSQKEKPALDTAAMRELFNGDWVGANIRIQIDGNKIIQYQKNDDGSWRPVSPEKQLFLQDRNNLVYIWLNTGEAGAETQVFSLSNIDNDALDLVWTRYADNMRQNDENSHQTLFRSGSTEAIAANQVKQSGTEAIPAQFHGDWIGLIAVDGRDANVRARLLVTQNSVTQYFREDDGSWRAGNPDNSCFEFDGNNLIFVWLNKGGIWTETQAYSLSVINDKTVNAVWSRHVNNYTEGNALNDAWYLGGIGQLIKQ